MARSECGTIKSVFKTPFGWAAAAVTEKGICMIVLPKKSRKAAEQELNSSTSRTPARGCKVTGSRSYDPELLLTRAVRLLRDYFSGKPVRFDVPLDIRYYTFFQQAVWRAAREIPSGETRSYAWVAARIRKPGAARAVGQAMGANPIPVLIP
jgi:O6-methylguanine-DNA--protein-cysteine methyltransferase